MHIPLEKKIRSSQVHYYKRFSKPIYISANKLHSMAEKKWDRK